MARVYRGAIMRIKIHFDSYIMNNDSVTIEGNNEEEIREKFKEWLISRDMDENTPAWGEQIDE